MRFDLVILGDTPDAWSAAEDAALVGRKTLVLRPETGDESGGIAAVLAAFEQESSNTLRSAGSPRDLWNEAVRRHRQSIERLERLHGVSALSGSLRLVEPGVIEVACRDATRRVVADSLLIAIGTKARYPRGLIFDGRTLLVPEDVPRLTDSPRSLIVLGGNRTALAFARLFLAAGSLVRIVDGRPSPSAPPMQHRIVGDVLDIRREPAGVHVRLTDGRVYSGDAVLFATDRVGATASLNLAAAGLETDEDGRLWCDDEGRTWVPSIHAAGEVVGYPRHLRDDPQAARRMTAIRGRRRISA